MVIDRAYRGPFRASIRTILPTPFRNGNFRRRFLDALQHDASLKVRQSDAADVGASQELRRGAPSSVSRLGRHRLAAGRAPDDNELPSATNLLERLFGEGRRRTKVIPHAFGERAVLNLMYAALISAAEH